MPQTSEPGVVLVRGAATGFVQHITIGRHELVSDEPIGAGGTDIGPGPYDLLLAALGACTSMTIAMYARRKSWPLSEVIVSLKHRRIHAQDCDDCITKDVMLDAIDREISLPGPLSSEQRSRLLSIADRCPVHRTLTSQIQIRTSLIDAASS